MVEPAAVRTAAFAVTRVHRTSPLQAAVFEHHHEGLRDGRTTVALPGVVFSPRLFSSHISQSTM